MSQRTKQSPLFKKTPPKSRLNPEDRPGVPGIIESILSSGDQPRAETLAQVRALALAIPGVAETTLYDGFCRHWTPAYYVGNPGGDGETQLFHVHNFKGGLRATVFTGGRKLVPLILDSEDLSEEMRQQAAQSSISRGAKQIKVNLNSAADVAALIKLAKLKQQSLTPG